MSNRFFRVLALSLAAAPTMPAQADAAPLREPTEEDIAAWRSIVDAQLTPDGQWFAYLQRPYVRTGDVVAVLRSVHGHAEYRFAAGDAARGAGALRMSDSGRWVAFRAAPDREGTNEWASGPQSARTHVIAVEIATRRTLEFPNVRSFSFIGSGAERIVLDSHPAAADDPRIKLTVRALESGNEMTLTGVREYAVNKDGTRLAWIGDGGVHVLDVASGRTRALDHGAADAYGGLTWSDRGNALAVLREDAGAERAIIAFTELNADYPRKHLLVPRRLRGFPAGFEISTSIPTDPDSYDPARSMNWREDEGGLFFGIRQTANETSGRAPRSIAPNLVLWHSRDERLPAQRSAEAAQPSSDLGYVSLVDLRFVRLSDPSLPHVRPHARGRFVLGYDASGYGWRNLDRGVRHSQARDYYLVDLLTGRRTPVVEELWVVKQSSLSAPPQLSPDGSVVLYQDNAGDYVAYDVATQAPRNLTAGLSTKFYYEENEPRSRRQPRFREHFGSDVLQGWTSNGAHVLISDYLDVWALPLKGGQAVNLTGNGKRERLLYDLAFRNQFGDGRGSDHLDLAQPMYFNVHDPERARNGLARRVSAASRAELLHSAEAGVQCAKARDANVYVCSMKTSVRSPDHYLLSTDRSEAKRLTDANPQQRELTWTPGAIHLRYTTTHGDRLSAALYLPVNYEPGKTYPTIVPDLYERGVGNPYLVAPPHNTYLDRWLRRGYAVLLLDVQPRWNESGKAALEAVTAAVDAAAATGVVDRARLGVIGHSHGGFEVYYILAHSDLFKAASAQAGYTNLLSAYGGVRMDEPRGRGMEVDQPFLSGPWWEQWDAFIENSPIFHAQKIRTPLLIVHGDQDPAVPFGQAVEMFNTMRRMGSPSTVLLQYADEDHSLAKETTKRDLDRRLEEFFDHLLKGAPAPAWWSEGRSYYEGQAPGPARSSSVH